MAYAPKKSPQPATSSSSSSGKNSNGYSDKKLIKKESNQNLLNTPIKFNDAEVKRMHLELEKREKASKRTNSPRQSTIISNSNNNTTNNPQKNKKKSSSTSTTLKSFILRVAIFYFLIAYFIVCPRDLNQSRSVCRNLNSLQTRIHSYEVYTKPIYTQVTKRLDPYLDQVQIKVLPYIEIVQPYYIKLEQFLTPHLETGVKFYYQRIEPKLFELFEFLKVQSKPLLVEGNKHYQSTLAPSVEWYTNFIKQWYQENIQRHYTLVHSTLSHYTTQIYEYVSPLYLEGLPILQKHYTQTLKPTTLTIYRTTKTTYIEQIHPRLLTGATHSFNFYKSKVSPALQRFWSLYIAPQVDEIRGKIFEYRIKKSEIIAEKEVEKEKEVLKSEVAVDDLDEFIAELREIEEPVVVSEPEPEVVVPIKSEEVEPTAEELLALTATKRAALEGLQTSYEKSIAKLGQVEHDLLVKRLTELRTNAALDIPKRFDSVIEDLDGEGDKMVGRLQKYFAKVAEDEKLSIEDKVKDADFLAKKALAKVHKFRDEILVEVENYRVTLVKKEEEAVTKASEALSDLVAKAQEELGFGWTWLDDVRHSDWARYHKLSKAQSTWSEYHSGVASGTIKDDDLVGLANPLVLLDDIKSQIDSLVDSFETILTKITLRGQKELKGESLGVINEVQKVLEVVNDKVVEVVEKVQESASSILDISATPSTIPETLSSVISEARESVVSVAQAVYEQIPEVPILSSASSVLEEVTASVTSIIEEITSTVEEVLAPEPTTTTSSSLVGGNVESISSVIKSVTSVIVNDLPESIASVYSVVEEVATSAISQIIPAVTTVSEESIPTPSNVIESVTSVVESLVSSVIEVITTSTVTSSATASHPTDEGFASSVSSVAESIHENAKSVIEEVKERMQQASVVVHEEL